MKRYPIQTILKHITLLHNIESFLAKRTQTMIIEGGKTTYVPVESGVPKGLS